MNRSVLVARAAMILIASMSAFAAGQEKTANAKPVAANPMAAFARMIPGEWRRTTASGKSTFDTWHWGPGRHSLRATTDGQGAAGEPWRELFVAYWHPGRKQICLLTMHPDVPGVGCGVGEGTMTFEGDRAEARYELTQPRGRRKLNLRWAFDGPDKYHATLLEAVGNAGFQPLVEWDFVRISARTQTAEAPPKLSENFKVFAPLVGHTWEAKGDAGHSRSTFEQLPLLDVIDGRVLAAKNGGEPAHVLDAYFYHHLGSKSLRCLALSDRGGGYEGGAKTLDDGALQLDLRGNEGDRVVPCLVHFDFERDGVVRQRVWTLRGTERTLTLDVRHAKVEPK
jgi:hypothetical protein